VPAQSPRRCKGLRRSAERGDDITSLLGDQVKSGPQPPDLVLDLNRRLDCGISSTARGTEAVTALVDGTLTPQPNEGPMSWGG
jgi:hypothetical protein